MAKKRSALRPKAKAKVKVNGKRKNTRIVKEVQDKPVANPVPVSSLTPAPEPEKVKTAVVPAAEAPSNEVVKVNPVVVNKDIEIAVVISNTRVPHHDTQALNLALMHTRDLGVAKIYFNGDCIDYFNRSDIDRNQLRILTSKEILSMRGEITKRIRDQESQAQADEDKTAVEKKRKPRKIKVLTDEQMDRVTKAEIKENAHRRELEILFGVMKQFRDAHPNAEFIWVWGCQEFYLHKYLSKYYPNLVWEIDSFCKQNKIQKVFNGTRNNTINYGPLIIGHWFRGGLNSPSGSVAHLLMDEEGVSLIQGHTNRGGWTCRTLHGGSSIKFISAFENFSMCKRPVGKNWQLGYSLVYKEKDRKRFQVFQVPIANYGFFWGLKEYRLDPLKVGEWETAVSISDIHLRFEDPEALNVTLGFIEELQPDYVYVNGDVPDFPDISRFSNTPLDILTDSDLANLSNLVLESKQQGKTKKYIKPRLQRDLESIYAFFKDLRRRCLKARIIWIFGNHDHRMQNYIEENASKLAGVRRPGEKGDILSLSEVAKVNEFGIEIVYSGQIESSTSYGDLFIGHWYRVANKSSFTARGLLSQKHKSLLVPHVHRMGACYKTQLDGTVLVAVEMGCLCQLQPHYMQNPNWQQGFVVIHKKKNSGRFYLQPIQLIDGAFLFGGKRYGR